MTIKPIAATAALCLVLASAGCAEKPEQVDGLNWRGPAKTPRGQSYYPARALRYDVTGFAALNCYMERDGRLKDCRLVYESPKEYGFGEAAMRMYSNVVVRMSEAEMVAAHADKSHFRVIQPVFFAFTPRDRARIRAEFNSVRRAIVMAEFGHDPDED